MGSFLLSNAVFDYFLLVISLLFLILTAVHFNNIRKEEFQQFLYKVQAINELTELLPIRAPLPAMIGWAATPELALNVYKIIEAEKPKKIIELAAELPQLFLLMPWKKLIPMDAFFPLTIIRILQIKQEER